MSVKTLSIDAEKIKVRFFWIGAALAIALSFAYVSLSSFMVAKAVAWDQLVEDTAKVNADMAVLESRYALLREKVSLENAAAFGFYEAAEPKFVSREPIHRGISLTNEI